METLPVELIHRIFGNLDAKTIFLSIRPVCRLFRSVVHTYDRFGLDTKSISKSTFYSICRLIKPENITSLSLSGLYTTQNQIDLFFSLVDSEGLTRLRSLTLLGIDNDELNFILKRLNLTLITSLSFTIRLSKKNYFRTNGSSVVSTYAFPNLHRLEYAFMFGLLGEFSWFANCSIQYLVINDSIIIENLFVILQSSPHLHTVILKKSLCKFNHPRFPKHSISTSSPQLMSLAIEELEITIDELESLLSLTPSLTYLKLIGKKMMHDGERWEQFIRTNLSQLHRFEFFFGGRATTRGRASNPEEILASYRTPFWVEHKKWLVSGISDASHSTETHLYTTPACKSHWTYQPGFKNLSTFNSCTTTENEPMTINEFKSLSLKLDEGMFNEVLKKGSTTNNPLFPNVSNIDITVTFHWLYESLKPLSIYINIACIVRLKLKPIYDRYDKIFEFTDMSYFLIQARNLLSLIIELDTYGYETYKRYKNNEHIYPICPRQLQHLQIPIDTLDEMKTILGRCKNLSTITLYVESILATEIIQWFNDNTVNSECIKSGEKISVQIGEKKIQSTDDRVNHKRIKLTDNRSDSELI